MAKTGYTLKSISAMKIADIKHLSEKEQRKVYSTLAQATNKRVKRLREAKLLNQTQFVGEWNRTNYSTKEINNKDSVERTMIIGRLLGMITAPGNNLRNARKRKKKEQEEIQSLGKEFDDVTKEYYKYFGSEEYYKVKNMSSKYGWNQTEMMNYMKSEIDKVKRNYRIEQDEIDELLGRK